MPNTTVTSIEYGAITASTPEIQDSYRYTVGPVVEFIPLQNTLNTPEPLAVSLTVDSTNISIQPNQTVRLSDLYTITYSSLLNDILNYERVDGSKEVKSKKLKYAHFEWKLDD
jgi:hypothetical protein